MPLFSHRDSAGESKGWGVSIKYGSAPVWVRSHAHIQSTHVTRPKTAGVSLPGTADYGWVLGTTTTMRFVVAVSATKTTKNSSRVASSSSSSTFLEFLQREIERESWRLAQIVGRGSSSSAWCQFRLWNQQGRPSAVPRPPIPKPVSSRVLTLNSRIFLSHVVVVEDSDSWCCRNGTAAGDPLEDYTMHSGVWWSDHNWKVMFHFQRENFYY